MNKKFINHLIDSDYFPFQFKKMKTNIIVWDQTIDKALLQVQKLYSSASKENLTKISFDDAIKDMIKKEEKIEVKFSKIQKNLNPYLHTYEYILNSNELSLENFYNIHEVQDLKEQIDLLKNKKLLDKIQN